MTIVENFKKEESMCIKFDQLLTARADHATFNAVPVQATRNILP